MISFRCSQSINFRKINFAINKDWFVQNYFGSKLFETNQNQLSLNIIPHLLIKSPPQSLEHTESHFSPRFKPPPRAQLLQIPSSTLKKRAGQNRKGLSLDQTNNPVTSCCEKVCRNKLPTSAISHSIPEKRMRERERGRENKSS